MFLCVRKFSEYTEKKFTVVKIKKNVLLHDDPDYESVLSLFFVLNNSREFLSS